MAITFLCMSTEKIMALLHLDNYRYPWAFGKGGKGTINTQLNIMDRAVFNFLIYVEQYLQRPCHFSQRDTFSGKLSAIKLIIANFVKVCSTRNYRLITDCRQSYNIRRN